MNAAAMIGMANSTANAGAAGQAKVEPNANDDARGDVFGWRSVLETLGLTSQICAPATAAGCRASSSRDPHGASDLPGATDQPVSLDQLGTEAFPAGQVTPPGASSQKIPNTVAIIHPKNFNEAASTGINSLRVRKHSDSVAPDREKRELGMGKEISAVPSVHVPVVSPESSGLVPTPAGSFSERSHNSGTPPQHAHQDALHHGGAIHVGSALPPHSQEDCDTSAADAKSSVVMKAPSPEATSEPLAAGRLPESDPLPEIASRQDAKRSKRSLAEIEFFASADATAGRDAAATGGPPTNSGERSDFLTKMPGSTSIPERITKSPLKPLTDLVKFGKQNETTQATPVVMPAMRETGEVKSPAERLINSSHNGSRDTIDPFATLDAERALPTPTWIRAGAHHAEAGYLDPALGWIGVRADSVANTLHASLVPSSGEAARVLGTHLADLNSYLSEHHGGVITMDAPQHGRSGMDGHQGDQPSSHDERSAGREEPAIAATTVGRQAAVGVSSMPAGVSAGGGAYISVLA